MKGEVEMGEVEVGEVEVGEVEALIILSIPSFVRVRGVP